MFGNTCSDQEDFELFLNVSRNVTTASLQYVVNFRGAIITLALTSGLSGMLIVLFTFSIYILLRTKMKRASHYFLLSALLLMLLSTWFFWAGVISNATTTQRGSYFTLHSLLDFMSCTLNTVEGQSASIGAQINLLNVSASPISPCVVGVMHANGQNTNISSIPHYFSTASLISSVIVGDSVVWWRAIALYPFNGSLKYISATFILATLIPSVVNIQQLVRESVPAAVFSYGGPAAAYNVGEGQLSAAKAPGQIFEGTIAGLATAVLSLASNLVATGFVVYKAWTVRKSIRLAVLGSDRPRFPAGEILAILAESGIVYCMIWIIITAFLVLEFGDFKFSNNFTQFMVTLSIIYQASLVPIIAMYPTVVILLVSAKRSVVEDIVASMHTSSAYPVPRAELRDSIERDVAVSPQLTRSLDQAMGPRNISLPCTAPTKICQRSSIDYQGRAMHASKVQMMEEDETPETEATDGLK